MQNHVRNKMVSDRSYCDLLMVDLKKKEWFFILFNYELAEDGCFWQICLPM